MVQFFKPGLARAANLPLNWSTELKEWAAQDSDLFWFENAHSTFYKIHQHSNPDAPVLLLLHGLPSSSFDFSHVWQDLSSQFTLVAPDFLGFGFSSKPKKYKYSFFEWATQVEELISHLGLWDREIHIFSFDIGVTVTQELLRRRMHMFEGVKLTYSQTERRADLQPLKIVSVFACNGGCIKVHNFFKELTENHVLANVLARISFNKYMFRFTLSRVSGRWSRKQRESGQFQHFLDNSLQLLYYNNGNRTIGSCMRALREQKYNLDRFRFAFRDTKVPIRFVDGPKDLWSGRHVANACKELFKDKENSDVKILADDIGHFCHIEDSESVMRLFWNFYSLNVARIEEKKEKHPETPARSSA